jgi:hypothetical protein
VSARPDAEKTDRNHREASMTEVTRRPHMTRPRQDEATVERHDGRYFVALGDELLGGPFLSEESARRWLEYNWWVGDDGRTRPYGCQRRRRRSRAQ